MNTPKPLATAGGITMEERLLFERAFIFEADNEKGFRKLRDHQFPRTEQGIVHEPIANALDQQMDAVPVEITLDEEDGLCILAYQDNGEGLTRDNLEALHWIGRSTKRSRKDQTIGRFGMGLIGAFNLALGVRRVEIRSTVCGVPSLIVIDSPDDAMPLWRQFPLANECPGLRITFFFERRNLPRIKAALGRFLERTVVSVRFNGRLRRFKPESIASQGDLLLVHANEPTVYHATHIDRNGYRPKDDLGIYLRNMPVEEGPMYHILYYSAGDKLPQNYTGVAFMQNESCLVLSRDGEPTIGRDSLLRNEAFERLKLGVEKARTQALTELLDTGRTGQRDPWAAYARDMALANLKSLRDLLAGRLNGHVPEKAYHAPLLEAILAFPLFPAFGSRTPLSIHDIVTAGREMGVILHARSKDAFCHFEGAHDCPFVLEEYRYVMSELFGGHTQERIGTLLKPVLNQLPDLELVDLDEAMWSEEKLNDLQTRGIIKMKPLRYSAVDTPGKETLIFMDRLRDMLNKPWFKRAFGRFRHPRRIHLHAVHLSHDTGQGRMLAAVMDSRSCGDDLHIGLFVDSDSFQAVLSHPRGPMALLPLLCHGLAHRRDALTDGEEPLPLGRSFHIERVRLEERILRACIRDLKGEDVMENDPLEDEAELLVL